MGSSVCYPSLLLELLNLKTQTNFMHSNDHNDTYEW